MLNFNVSNGCNTKTGSSVRIYKHRDIEIRDFSEIFLFPLFSKVEILYFIPSYLKLNVYTSSFKFFLLFPLVISIPQFTDVFCFSYLVNYFVVTFYCSHGVICVCVCVWYLEDSRTKQRDMTFRVYKLKVHLNRSSYSNVVITSPLKKDIQIYLSDSTMLNNNNSYGSRKIQMTSPVTSIKNNKKRQPQKVRETQSVYQIQTLQFY